MKLILLITIIAVTLITCDNCNKMGDCVPPSDTFRFNYVSAGNEDLLGGATKKYNLNDIKFYSISINNKKVFSDIHIFNELTPDLSIAEVYLNSNEERAFLEINGMIADTVDFKFNKSNSKCCGAITRIEGIKLNEVEYPYSQEYPVLIIEEN
ncbi:MAG TPA: hypothetical protein VIT44_03635 [Cyclobacteriaceae bacterium]